MMMFIMIVIIIVVLTQVIHWNYVLWYRPYFEYNICANKNKILFYNCQIIIKNIIKYQIDKKIYMYLHYLLRALDK